jgi:hypothetical protein
MKIKRFNGVPPGDNRRISPDIIPGKPGKPNGNPDFTFLFRSLSASTRDKISIKTGRHKSRFRVNLLGSDMPPESPNRLTGPWAVPRVRQRPQDNSIIAGRFAATRLSSAKLREIRVKIAEGYYDRPEFIERLADRLIQKLCLNEE